MACTAGYLDSDVNFEKLEQDYQKFARIVKEKYDCLDTSIKEVPWKAENNVYMNMVNNKSEVPEIIHLLLSAMVRSQCEAVTESMGSIMKNNWKGRTELHAKTQAKELFLHWNGPPASQHSIKLVESGLDLYFGRREEWHFVRKSPLYKLKSWSTSKVVERMNKEARIKIPF